VKRAPREFRSRAEQAETLRRPWREELIKTLLEADRARDAGDHLEVAGLQRRAAGIRRHLGRLERLA